MIKKLTYSVVFPTNGIALKGDVSFEPGITAIIGDNGNGKTFGSIELVRYMLFGMKALRGPATDYKALDATMTFSIQGADYSVERNRKFQKLSNAQGEIMAMGAEAVSQRIIQLLGFGLDVFDVVCASVQKESDKLSKMLPTARKRLIDEVIGLSSNEAVEKACRDEAKALRRDADVLTDNLVPVAAPVKPDRYKVSSSIKAELDAANAQQEQRRKLSSIVDSVGQAPALVEEPKGDLEGLIVHEKNRVEIEAQVAHAKAELARIPDAEYTAEQLDEAEALNAYEAEVTRRGPRPTISQSDAEGFIDAWEHIALLSKIGETEVECPKCVHVFRPGQDLPEFPAVGLAVAQAELRANEKWANDLPVNPKVRLRLTYQSIAEGRLALARAADKQTLLATTWLKVPEDCSVELNALRTTLAQREAYVAAKARYDQSSLAATVAQSELDALPPLTADIKALDQAYVEARVYETQAAAHDVAQKVFDDTSANITAKVEKSGAFKKGAEALIKARQSVKAHLAPSLSRVSSSLIHQMSGGVFSAMIVDEDMNITVDGQDIATLSGAGSTVANLALRLALGQVLVRNIFPVFIADEADADLSDSRAQFTAECLANLKDQLSQIIVITHKEVTAADHIVTR
jgi:exonuclease SbcC